MKKFYKLVSHEKRPGGYAILLDGKPLKTPGKKDFLVSSQALAGEIVREWAGQGDEITPDSLPLTQIVNTKLDRVIPQRTEITALVLKYLDTDLLCYRTAHPPELAKLQAESRDPFLDRFEKRFGARLDVTTGLAALKQAQTIHDAVADYVAALDDDDFTVLQLVTSLSGSLVIALAFISGETGPEELFAAATVEERYKAQIYNEKKYGPDPSQDKAYKAIQADLHAAKDFLNLSKI